MEKLENIPRNMVASRVNLFLAMTLNVDFLQLGNSRPARACKNKWM